MSASRQVNILQDSGSCSFQYDPGNIGAGTVVQYSRTQVTGQITGNSVATSGGALIPAAGAQLIESSFQATGSVSGNTMTLSGSGPAHIKQTVDAGLVADISCTLTSTATFTRNSSGPGPTAVPRVVNGASFVEGPVAPGEIVSIFGAQMGPAQGVSGKLNAGGRVDTSLAGVTVQFDGVPAPLFYVRSDQINAQIPYAVAGKSSTHLQVLYQGAASEASVPVAPAAPAIFASSTETSRAVVLNQSGAVNSAASPAAPGEVITLFATGEGQTDPPGLDGKPADAPYPVPVAPVTLQIDGQNADIQYAGAAPGFAGLMQVNARVPAGIAGGGSVPLQLFVGGVSSPRLTVAVQGPTSCTACSDLSVTMTASPNPAPAGGNITYTINVRNVGATASANAVLTDTLPANATFKSSSLAVTRSGNTLTYSLGSLAAGANVMILLVVAAPAAAASTTVTNAASVSVAGDPNLGNNQASQTVTVTPSAAPLVSVPTLLAPVNNAVVQQNDPATGCSANPAKGYGWGILFDWTDSTSSNGIQRYEIYVIHSGAPGPGIDTFVTKSEFSQVSCNSFVIDQNLQGWQWRVRAQDTRGNYSDWTPWGAFQYAPCRLKDGTACYAPP
ncbi:MAG TPA: hypothetical protein VFA33_00475 [Bryobacteraceae bacterium]|nr:hypothetical protein [Bryobacteraceae bacterium]